MKQPNLTINPHLKINFLVINVFTWIIELKAVSQCLYSVQTCRKITKKTRNRTICSISPLWSIWHLTCLQCFMLEGNWGLILLCHWFTNTEHLHLWQGYSTTLTHSVRIITAAEWLLIWLQHMSASLGPSQAWHDYLNRHHLLAHHSYAGTNTTALYLTVLYSQEPIPYHYCRAIPRIVICCHSSLVVC